MSEVVPIRRRSLHVAADWLGHSTAIADKHYRQTTECPVTSAQGDMTKTVPIVATDDYDVLRYLTALQVGDEGLEPPTFAV